MARTRVEDRADLIYAHLKAHLNKPFTIGALMAATGLTDSSTTRSAIKRARALAETDGLCFPVACYDNGNTYTVTDDPTAVVDPSLHLGKIAVGVGVRKDVHDRFIRSRMSHLSPIDRALINNVERYEAAQRDQREAYRALLKTVSEVRRVTKDDLPERNHR